MLGTRDPYFDWLCMSIDVGKHPSGRRNYMELCTMLHSIEFQAKLPLDVNRAMDGMQLRVTFMQQHGEYGSATNRGGCTMLELLVALSKQMSFMMYGNEAHHRTPYYFSVLMKNLGLWKLTDENWYSLNGEFFVDDAVYRVINRLYDADGKGGLFPLKHPKEDQRCVEIWYQMHAWLGENCEIDLSI